MKSPNTLESLKRPIQPMPDFVAKALRDRNLTDAYVMRPPYQRNDYLSWINRAVRETTKQKRLNQMLEELATGHNYMGMQWTPRNS